MSAFARFLTAALVAVAALTAPGWAAAQDATPPAGCADLDDATMAAMARAWTDHSFSGEPDPAFDAMLAPDLLYHSAAFGDVDGAGWLAGRAVLGKAFPDGAITVNQTIVDPPWAVTQWTARATFTGDFMGMPATGAPVDWDAINIYRFDCGRIAEAWTQIDQLGRLDPVTPAADRPATPVAACADPAAPVSDAAAEAIVDAWWGGLWGAGDAAAFEQISHEDILHHWAMGPDTVGRDAIVERVGKWRAAMPDIAFTHAEVLVDGDLAAARWTGTGTDTGGVNGTPPTGKAVTMEGINLFRVQCGQVTEIWSEMDAAGFLEQLGS
ncbi:MAG: ester cyclase [Chloroflexota bacterium]